MSKQCNKCGVVKPETEFYLAKGSRREQDCKQCRLARQKQFRANNPKAKFEPIDTGSKACADCGVVKPISDFQVNRVKKDGRKSVCGSCCSLLQKESTRSKGPIYNIGSCLDADVTDFVKASCDICNGIFEPMRPSHTRCEPCGYIARIQVFSMLKRARGGRKTGKVDSQAVIDISKKYLLATSCCYCARTFSDTITKSFDHIVPVCKGGTSDPDNINICCYDCNISKSRAPLADWIDLCIRVSEYNGALMIDFAVTHKDGYCDVCDIPFERKGQGCSQIRCAACVILTRTLISKALCRPMHKGEKCLPVSTQSISEVARKYIAAEQCCYCGDGFSYDVPKSFDHIIPICDGGDGSSDNIAICCLDCNRSKERLSVAYWKQLCALVVANMAK